MRKILKMKKNKLLSGKWILSGAKIYDPYKDKLSKGDLLLDNGKIKKIGVVNRKDKNINIIDCSGKIITSSFIDIRSHFRQPGSGYTETISSGVMAAMAGGYTTVCVMSDVDSPLDNPENIKYIIDNSKEFPVNILPIGSISLNHKGKELSEFGQMVDAGAVAFSDTLDSIKNSQLLRYALEYSRMYNVPIINYAEDIGMTSGGVVNEGIISTKLGLKGISDISEATVIFRDLMIAEQANSRIHIPLVSTKQSIDIIKEFQKKGINVTAEVTPHHIAFNEEAVSEYNTNAKVYPPLRSEKNRKEIIKGLKNKIITCISSDHSPHSSEDKEKDIQHAPFGTISLESAFAVSCTELSKNNFNITEIIKLFTVGPKRVLGIDVESIAVGNNAKLVVIDTKKTWIFKESDIYSKSKNSLALGMQLSGRVDLTISGKNAFGYF